MELYSESIENAVASWKTVQGLPDYKTLVGELLFRAIFTISPGAINMFGFGEGVDCYHLPETLFKLPAFQNHTNAVVTMLEKALEMMLGKNMESLAEALSTLGEQHVTYGIQPPHYIIVESALVRTLELGLGTSFTNSLRKDWEAVFRFISRTMMMGAESRVQIVKSTRRSAENKKVATIRLNAISPGRRSKVLTRNSRTSCARFEGEPKRRYARRGSDPPQQPSREGTFPRSHSLSELPAYEHFALDDVTIDATAETRTMTLPEHDEPLDTRGMTLPEHDEPLDPEAYWAWGTDSNVLPPKMPPRAVSPPRSSSKRPVLIRYNSFDSVSTLGSGDSAPAITPAQVPRRKPQRSPSTKALLRNTSFDSLSTMAAVDFAPVFPKRASSPPRTSRRMWSS